MTPVPALVTLREFCAMTEAPVWAIIDGVNCSLMTDFFVHGAICLYSAAFRGDRSEAPWLVRISDDERAMQLISILPGDAHWGYLFSSDQPGHKLRAHFRKFIMIPTPASEGSPVYFRFYDPRVCFDAFAALEPDHLARLFAPVRNIAVPLSPQMGSRAGLHPLTEREAFHDRFITLTPPDPDPDPYRKPVGFTINKAEFARFNALQHERDIARLTRDLHFSMPDFPVEDITYIASTAPDLARKYGLVSYEHVRIIAECMVHSGLDFPACHNEARAILAAPDITPWQKADALRDWLARGGPLTGRSFRRHGDDVWVL